MSGLMFYWLGWMALTVFAFFVPKTSRLRMPAIVHLLALIFLSGYEAEVFGQFRFNMAGLYVFLAAAFYVRKETVGKLLYFVLASLTAAAGYAAFMEFSMLDPILLFADPFWLLAGGLIYTVMLMAQEWKMRLFILVTGLAAGDFLFAAILSYSRVPYTAGSLSWLDTLAPIVLICLLLNGIQSLSRKAGKSIIKKNQYRERSTRITRM